MKVGEVEMGVSDYDDRLVSETEFGDESAVGKGEAEMTRGDSVRAAMGAEVADVEIEAESTELAFDEAD